MDDQIRCNIEAIQAQLTEAAVEEDLEMLNEILERLLDVAREAIELYSRKAGGYGLH